MTWRCSRSRPARSWLLHTALAHYSEASLSDASRHAYSIHVVESDGVEYLLENWLKRPGGARAIPLFNGE